MGIREGVLWILVKLDLPSITKVESPPKRIRHTTCFETDCTSRQRSPFIYRSIIKPSFVSTILLGGLQVGQITLGLWRTVVLCCNGVQYATFCMLLDISSSGVPSGNLLD